MSSPLARASTKPRKKIVIVVLAVLVVLSLGVWALYALNKPAANQTTKTTSRTSQSGTILTIDISLQQNGATQICSAGNAGPGNLSTSSADIAYEIGKNRSDTAALIKEVAADSGYGNLSHTTNGSADFYEGKSKDASTTISFVVYSDRKFTSCQPTPSTDPNQTAFMLSMMSGH